MHNIGCSITSDDKVLCIHMLIYKKREQYGCTLFVGNYFIFFFFVRNNLFHKIYKRNVKDICRLCMF